MSKLSGRSSKYRASHKRTVERYGNASEYACQHCAGQATQWAYDHEDPDEVSAMRANGVVVYYSVHPEHYLPLCHRCHVKFDNTIEKIAAALRGKPLSAAHRDKIGAKLKGRRGLGGASRHVRWHVNRGINSSDCPLCESS